MSLDDLYNPETDGESRDHAAEVHRRHEARGRAAANDRWIADEFESIERELTALRAIKRDKRQPKVFLQVPSEVLKAHEQGVITKAEARKILGLSKTRQPAQLRGGGRK